MASIRDIAKMAGVSAASVSRILNEDPTFSINEQTRIRVIEIANRLNYSVKQNKRGSRTRGNELALALIVRHQEKSEEDDPYFRKIRIGIEKEAAKWRLRTEVAFRMRDEEKNWSQLSQYGAVIMIGEMTERAVKRIAQANNNLIFVDNYSKTDQYDCIQTDFERKTAEVLQVLYDKGHRRIAFVGGYSSIVDEDGSVVHKQEEVRASSYETWMKLKGLEECTAVYQGSWKPESGLELGAKMLAQKELPSAVLVASDPMAVGVYKAINEAGLKIPEDIAVVSFDDIEMAQFLTPSLSSIKADPEEMGRLAVRIAKERMLEERKMPIRIICGSQLILRDSI
ncbi:LacI family DNA-binding transcriptional regulator [Enterococcus asini]|uniref:LacI family DNA-binding transcriptional regulator n=1 Tax=Enterococcus asini TaxID=57732 RepID=UPI00288CB99D|nr:LacI family DNA-binding transcriptional regulator [Enterococcus asini]MDT2757211.1 LacI family DNA-binding transcriptional regulator [Enterococcus asini]